MVFLIQFYYYTFKLSSIWASMETYLKNFFPESCRVWMILRGKKKKYVIEINSPMYEKFSAL